MKRLGIGATFQQAFGALWLRRKTVSMVVLGWFVLDLTYNSARSYFSYYALPDVLSGFPVDFRISDSLFVIELVSQALRSLLGCGFALILLRLLLVGLQAGSGFGAAMFARSMGSILAFDMALTMAYGTARQVAYRFVSTVPSWTWTIVTLAIWLVAVWLGCRLCLVYANAALRGGWQIRQSWRKTAGCSLPLFMLFGMVSAGSAMVGRMFDAFLPIARDVVESAMPIGLAVLAIPESMVHVAVHILLLSLIAVVFARLTDFPAEGIPGAAPTPEQLVETFE